MVTSFCAMAALRLVATKAAAAEVVTCVSGFVNADDVERSTR
jgi:hypothetical protein